METLRTPESNPQDSAREICRALLQKCSSQKPSYREIRNLADSYVHSSDGASEKMENLALAQSLLPAGQAEAGKYLQGLLCGQIRYLSEKNATLNAMRKVIVFENFMLNKAAEIPSVREALDAAISQQRHYIQKHDAPPLLDAPLAKLSQKEAEQFAHAHHLMSLYNNDALLGSNNLAFIYESVKFQPDTDSPLFLNMVKERIGEKPTNASLPQDMGQIAVTYLTTVAKTCLRLADMEKDQTVKSLMLGLADDARKAIGNILRMDQKDRVEILERLIAFKYDFQEHTGSIMEQKYWANERNIAGNDLHLQAYTSVRRYGETGLFFMAMGIGAINPLAGAAAFAMMGARQIAQGDLAGGMMMLLPLCPNKYLKQLGSLGIGLDVGANTARTAALSARLGTLTPEAQMSFLNNTFILGGYSGKISETYGMVRESMRARDAQDLSRMVPVRQDGKGAKSGGERQAELENAVRKKPNMGPAGETEHWIFNAMREEFGKDWMAEEKPVSKNEARRRKNAPPLLKKLADPQAKISIEDLDSIGRMRNSQIDRTGMDGEIADAIATNPGITREHVRQMLKYPKSEVLQGAIQTICNSRHELFGREEASALFRNAKIEPEFASSFLYLCENNQYARELAMEDFGRTVKMLKDSAGFLPGDKFLSKFLLMKGEDGKTTLSESQILEAFEFMKSKDKKNESLKSTFETEEFYYTFASQLAKSYREITPKIFSKMLDAVETDRIRFGESLGREFFYPLAQSKPELFMCEKFRKLLGKENWEVDMHRNYATLVLGSKTPKELMAFLAKNSRGTRALYTLGEKNFREVASSWETADKITEEFGRTQLRARVISKNVAAMAALERSSQGACKALYENNGIRNFARYPPEMLLDQLGHIAANNQGRAYPRETIEVSVLDAAGNKIGKREVEKPVLLVIYPFSDHNGAFLGDVNILKNLRRDFTVVVFEAKTKRDAARALRRTGEYFGQGGIISAVIAGGHGETDNIAFSDGPNGVLRAENFAYQGLNKYFLQGINPFLLFFSCSTGAPEGIAFEISRSQQKATVIAPKDPTRVSAVSFLGVLENGTPVIIPIYRGSTAEAYGKNKAAVGNLKASRTELTKKQMDEMILTALEEFGVPKSKNNIQNIGYVLRQTIRENYDWDVAKAKLKEKIGMEIREAAEMYCITTDSNGNKIIDPQKLENFPKTEEYVEVAGHLSTFIGYETLQELEADANGNKRSPNMGARKIDTAELELRALEEGIVLEKAENGAFVASESEYFNELGKVKPEQLERFVELAGQYKMRFPDIELGDNLPKIPTFSYSFKTAYASHARQTGASLTDYMSSLLESNTPAKMQMHFAELGSLLGSQGYAYDHSFTPVQHAGRNIVYEFSAVKNNVSGKFFVKFSPGIEEASTADILNLFGRNTHRIFLSNSFVMMEAVDGMIMSSFRQTGQYADMTAKDVSPGGRLRENYLTSMAELMADCAAFSIDDSLPRNFVIGRDGRARRIDFEESVRHDFDPKQMLETVAMFGFDKGSEGPLFQEAFLQRMQQIKENFDDPTIQAGAAKVYEAHWAELQKLDVKFYGNRNPQMILDRFKNNLDSDFEQNYTQWMRSWVR